MQLSPNLSIYFFIFIFGLCFGSFFSLVAFRLEKITSNFKSIKNYKPPRLLNYFLPQKSIWLKVLLSQSACSNCLTPIKPLHNIPVFSYFYLKKKCPQCSIKISPLYLWFELFFALNFVFFISLSFNQIIPLYHAIALLFFVFILALISYIDLKTQKIWNDLNFLLLWSGLLFNSFSGFVSVSESVLAASLVFLALKIIHYCFFIIRRKKGLGDGDIYLLSAIGSWVGLNGCVWILVLSSLTGIVFFSIFLIAKKIKYTTKLPFAPCIFFGSMTYILFNLLNA